MTSSQLVSNGDFALLSDIDTYELIDAWWQFVADFAVTLVARQDLDVNNFAAFAVLDLEARVANFASLFTEDCAQEALFRCQFGFALWRNFSNQHIARSYFGTNANDSAIVQVGQNVF